MNCAVHPETEATGYCRQCGKPLCAQCSHEIRGALYCESCLVPAAPSSLPPSGVLPTPGAQPRNHPGVALCLGFIPGLGAVYNGEYVKALVQIIIFGGIIAALTADLPGAGYYAMLGIGLGCFYFYMPIDAYRVARARSAGEPEGSWEETGGSRQPTGPIILIGLGVLFLLANFGLLRSEWFGRVWPLALIALGVWILFSRFRTT